MPTTEKTKTVTELTEKINKAKGILLTDFRGLNVTEISQLRQQLRQHDIEYRVVKNTLAKISVKQLGLTQIMDYFEGPTAIAISLDDPLAPAKIISEYLKKNNKPAIKACLLQGQVYTGDDLLELTKLPDKNVLIAQLLGTINSPISNFVYALQNILQKMVLVLNSIKEKKEQQV